MHVDRNRKWSRVSKPSRYKSSAITDATRYGCAIQDKSTKWNERQIYAKVANVIDNGFVGKW